MKQLRRIRDRDTVRYSKNAAVIEFCKAKKSLHVLMENKWLRLIKYTWLNPRFCRFSKGCGGHLNVHNAVRRRLLNPHPLVERYFHDPKWMCPRYFKEYFLRLIAIEGVFPNLGSS
jgi:hypothetical protein